MIRWSRHSARTLRRKRSRMALAFGVRTGVRRIWIPVARASASNPLPNLASLSRIRHPRQQASDPEALEPARCSPSPGDMISAIVSPEIRDRQARPRFDRRCQSSAKPRRCHRRMVSGLIRRSASRQLGVSGGARFLRFSRNSGADRRSSQYGVRVLRGFGRRSAPSLPLPVCAPVGQWPRRGPSAGSASTRSRPCPPPNSARGRPSSHARSWR